MNVLLVDDDVFELEALQSVIHWNLLGVLHLFHCTNIYDAKTIFQSHHIDIMLCDIEMPHGSGLDLLDWIQMQHYTTLSILFTCHASFNYAKRSMQMGAFDYILKPINVEEIESCIKKAKQKLLCSHSSNTYAMPSEESTIEHAQHFIAQNINRPITREEIAQKVFLHPDYLSKLFKKELGIGITDYITIEKIKVAKYQLAHTKKSISSIAIDLGYNNFSYFSKLFKKHTGCTPIEYRNQGVTSLSNH